MEKQFRKYLNGTCTPQEFARVTDSFDSNQGQEKVAADILEHWNDILHSEAENRENDHLLDKIHHRIALEDNTIKNKRLVVYQTLLKVASILILGLTTTFIVFYNKVTIKPVALVIQKISTPFGARTNFTLPDGSEVWLNSGSTISFPQQYGETRGVELQGQAYFKVAKESKPFVVKTGYGSIEVMGTSFDVKAYMNENFETTLVEGSVKIEGVKKQSTILRPGQQSILAPSSDVFLLKNVNTGLFTSWKEGKLIFVNEPFKNVARELERWYNVKIELRGQKLKDLCYTGTIEMETFGEVLELINTTTPIKHSFDKHSRLLIINER
ncbi:MAG: FecR domain-containing protein [Mariniphaga sp.]